MAPAGGAQKAIPSQSIPKTPLTAAAKAIQPPTSSPTPQSSTTTLSAEIHKLASDIVEQPADSTLIRDLEDAAGNDLKLLRDVLGEMDRKRTRYTPDFKPWFIDDVFRQCQERRSELK